MCIFLSFPLHYMNFIWPYYVGSNNFPARFAHQKLLLILVMTNILKETSI